MFWSGFPFMVMPEWSELFLTHTQQQPCVTVKHPTSSEILWMKSLKMAGVILRYCLSLVLHCVHRDRLKVGQIWWDVDLGSWPFWLEGSSQSFSPITAAQSPRKASYWVAKSDHRERASPAMSPSLSTAEETCMYLCVHYELLSLLSSHVQRMAPRPLVVLVDILFGHRKRFKNVI